MAKMHGKAKKKQLTPKGTIRINARGLNPVEWKNGSWKKSLREFPEAMQAIELFRAHKNFDSLVDKKEPRFLKGQLSPDGLPLGARLNVLPDKRKLNGAYSLFAEQLAIHDEASNAHWDVLYKNPSGSYAHLYTLEKRGLSVKKKFAIVEKFGRKHALLERNVLLALGDKKDNFAVPMYTLLKTMMRVGNEIYFRAHHHKGLTTLKKGDISINGRKVGFNYLSKGGVPRKIIETFPKIYIERLGEILKPLKKNSFVFANASGHPLRDTQFKKAFKRYCGEAFYPHIVRSYYATARAKEFLKSHRSAAKKDANALFLSIAEKLGHKKFVKKKHSWEDSFNVTIHHYIQPEIVEKIRQLPAKP